jgi:hypothetical protein
MTRVAGLDVGLSLTRSTSGVATVIGPNIQTNRVKGGAQSCAPILANGPFQVIAIDGPIVPAGGDAGLVRAVERLFASGPFQRRCKPGFSHVAGTGRQLRMAAGRAADCLAPIAIPDATAAPFPAVRPGGIVEAFPNAFLGVCLDDQCYCAMPKLRRGRKFDWLYQQWVSRNLVAQLPLPGNLIGVPTRFAATSDHEERAALVCALTALLTALGAFTAVGDDAGGWFFLPPWGLWQPWAQNLVKARCTRLNPFGGTTFRI